MKTYKIGCIIAVVLCLVAIIASLIFKYTFPIEILDNIFIGIFASAFVVFITYLTEYFIKKREIICLTIHYGREYHNAYIEFLNDFFNSTYKDGLLDIARIIDKVQNDRNINIEVKNLIRRNEERLLAVKEFSPFFKKNKCNMEIMRLFFVLSDLNDLMASFDYEYKKFNNIIYKNKPRSPMFSEEKLKERIFLLSEKENNPCEELAQLLIFLDKKYIRQIGRKTR